MNQIKQYKTHHMQQMLWSNLKQKHDPQHFPPPLMTQNTKTLTCEKKIKALNFNPFVFHTYHHSLPLPQFSIFTI